MNLNCTPEELVEIIRWKKSLKHLAEDINDKEFQHEYIFYQTGLGIIKKVRRGDGEEIDITDYDN